MSSYPQDFVVLEADGEDRLLNAAVLEAGEGGREGKLLGQDPVDRSGPDTAGFRYV